MPNECKCDRQELSTAQQKIDEIVESKQLKYYTKDHIDKKYRLEAENELLTLEINNYNLKNNLKVVKEAASGIKPLR